MDFITRPGLGGSRNGKTPEEVRYEQAKKDASDEGMRLKIEQYNLRRRIANGNSSQILDKNGMPFSK